MTVKLTMTPLSKLCQCTILFTDCPLYDPHGRINIKREWIPTCGSGVIVGGVILDCKRFVQIPLVSMKNVYLE